MNQDESLKITVAEITANIKILEQQLRDHKTPTTEINLDASHEFRREKCSYIFKREATLCKHIKTKHQLDLEEVDIVFQNDSNEKELKKLNLGKRELKEKVEQLALGKTKVECEVKRLQKYPGNGFVVTDVANSKSE